MEVEFPLGEHLVVEVDGVLSCRLCGGKAPIEESDKFAEKPCSKANGAVEKTATTADRCAACGSATELIGVPMLDPLTKTLSRRLLCRGCYGDYLKILRNAGPRVGRFKARAPPGKIWFSFGESYVLFEELGGAWPCPSCDQFFDDLYDVAVHFAEKHPELANKPLEKAVLNVEGEKVEVPRTFQGLACPYCGFFAENERHLTYHIQHDHQ